MGLRKKLIYIIALVFILSAVDAITLQGNLECRSLFNVTDADYITANYFVGDGTLLTGLGIHTNLTGSDVVSMVGNWTHGMSTLPNISLSDVVINIGNFSDENDTLVHIGAGNQTLPYCGNITGGVSDLCTIVNTDTNLTGADVVSMVGNWTHGMSTLPNISLSDAAINLGNFSNENDTLLHVGQGLNVTEVSQFADDIKLIFGTDADVYIMFNTTCGCGELG